MRLILAATVVMLSGCYQTFPLSEHDPLMDLHRAEVVEVPAHAEPSLLDLAKAYDKKPI